MRMTWIVGLAMLFFIGTGISMTLENEYIGSEGVQYEDKYGNPCDIDDPGAKPVGVISTFYTLVKPDFAQFTNPLQAIGGFFVLAWNWIVALWKVFWWDYAFFTGTWAILKYLGWAISLGVIVALIMAIRGVGST
ncbi:unnamed protein product [marine sediment metagenome]|uniref:Uncharacterized protein n=1 Tax=marine sediment metagenome TaxID=412755 RepID=X1GEW1_9ZZZZ